MVHYFRQVRAQTEHLSEMNWIGPAIALAVIGLAARMLLRKYNAQAVLLGAGLILLIAAFALKLPLPEVKKPTGFQGFDLFVFIGESFAKTNAGVGLMIMAIGGFVAYSKHIGASDALVHIAVKPLHRLRNNPQLAATFVLPIGHLLSLCIPSAAGLGLLLMTTVYPILRRLGVSKIAGVAVITGSTGLCVGPASVITNSAISIMEIPIIPYFLGEQIPLVWPTLGVLMVVYYAVNKYFDARNPEGLLDSSEDEKTESLEHTAGTQGIADTLKAPWYYALIPVLPLILLILFSELFTPFGRPIKLHTTTAMLISMAVALVLEGLRKRDGKTVLNSLSIFWTGMANIFKSVVTLIIAADIFAKGLIAMGFISGLTGASQAMGVGPVGIGVVLTLMIFGASMLMGSANAAFFAFGPLVPKIAGKVGATSLSALLPMNIAASMGRAISPVSGVLLATSEIAGLSSMQVVRRNLIPMTVGLVFLLILHYL